MLDIQTRFLRNSAESLVSICWCIFLFYLFYRGSRSITWTLTIFATSCLAWNFDIPRTKGQIVFKILRFLNSIHNFPGVNLGRTSSFGIYILSIFEITVWYILSLRWISVYKILSKNVVIIVVYTVTFLTTWWCYRWRCQSCTLHMSIVINRNILVQTNLPVLTTLNIFDFSFLRNAN